MTDTTSPRPLLAICMPMARGAHPSTVHDLLMLEDVRPYHYVERVGQQVDWARNQITEQVLAIPGVTHFLWIDDDMTFPPDAAKRLLAHDLPIVGGLCHNRRHPFMPILMHMTERGFAYQYDYPEGLVEVAATGAAFLLVKREVLAEISEKCNKAKGEAPWMPMGLGLGEDVSFCLRAAQLGYKIKVDTTLKIGHIGESVIDEAFARRNRMFKGRPWYPTNLPAPEGPPVASIIIPTFNQEPGKLLAAVKSALDQTVPVEVIVIDDGSTPGSVDEALAPLSFAHTDPVTGVVTTGPVNLRVLTNKENVGLWRTLNRGVQEMTTDWFCWLSSDDLLYPPKVEQQLAAMDRLDKKVSFHAYDVLTAPGLMQPSVIVPAEWKTMEEQQHFLAQGCFINGLTTMIHRSVFEKVGHFDPTIAIASDWEFWNRVGREFFWLPIPELLATRRDYDNATNRYAKDPEKRAIWLAEDAAIRAQYTALLGAKP